MSGTPFFPTRAAALALLPCAFALLLPTPSVADCDAAAPALTGFDFSPKLIDVGSGPESVTCEMSLTDDVSGVSEVTCTFISPTFVQQRSCTAQAPSSGTRLDGTFSCTVEFPEHVDAGTWSVNAVTAVDAVGRVRSVSTFELQSQGFPTSLSVVSPTPDLSGPTVSDFDFTPKSVNVVSNGQEVTCSVEWSDPLAGVEFSSCSFAAPNSDQAQGCVAFTPSSGTPNAGTYECTLTIPRYSEDGTWRAVVSAQDKVGNFGGLDADGLAGQGFPTDLTVTSIPDLAPPFLDDFTISPTSIDVSSASRTVTCTMTVSDGTAGVWLATCQIGVIDGFSSLAHECTADTPVSGTRNDGVFACDVTIPAFSPGGTWQVQSVELVDQVTNARDYTTLDLSSSGFPTDVDVTCSGGGPGEEETTLSWSDKDTLTWDPIADAVEYNVYRGLLSDLEDFDADGLPDQAYGECRNGSDPDTTDTQYFDDEVPITLDGFHYLVGYDSASQSDLGLGTTSAGLDREPTTPCP